MQTDLHANHLYNENQLHIQAKAILWIQKVRIIGGIQNLQTFNSALLGKWWWKIISSTPRCGEVIIRENYFKRVPLWNLFHRQCGRCSFFWSGILHILPAFRNNLTSIIRNGASTLFWLDNWVDGRAPADIWPHLFISAHHKEETVRDYASRMTIFPSNDFPTMNSLLLDLNSHLSSKIDKKCWKLKANGKFSVKTFYNFLNDGGLRCRWTPYIRKGICP